MTPSRIEELRRMASEWEFDKRIPAHRAARLLRELLGRVDELERGIGQMRLLAGLPLPPDVVAKLAEADRLRRLFDDAGQGEHNVLALVDHYQDAAIKADSDRDAFRDLLTIARRFVEELAKAMPDSEAAALLDEIDDNLTARGGGRR